MLLGNRRHQMNYEQALQSYCPVSSGSIQYTLSGHPMFGETAIINCIFRNMSLYNSLSISWLSYSNVGPFIPQNGLSISWLLADWPVNFMTKLNGLSISWLSYCNVNFMTIAKWPVNFMTELQQRWSIYPTTEAHVKMATIEWQKPSTKGNLQKHKSKPLKIRKQKLALHCLQPKSLTLLPQNRCY